MPRRKLAPSASGSHLRRTIATAAARLMAEEGIGDYGAAKRKAARSLGASEGEALPTNEEIETELRAWQSLYQEDEQRERVHDLRTTALEVMQLLTEFHPYLTGGALDGTAGRYSAVEIDLYADSSKDVEIALLSHGISYDTMDNRRVGLDAQLRLDWNDFPVLISVYPPVAERQQPKNSHGGRGRHRVRAEAVLELLREAPK
ncbi:MAG: nucleotidyltransferase [Sulfuritalea sp.]|nr:nucleotidyltransferase [Sulfuritalea sp.]